MTMTTNSTPRSGAHHHRAGFFVSCSRSSARTPSHAAQLRAHAARRTPRGCPRSRTRSRQGRDQPPRLASRSSARRELGLCTKHGSRRARLTTATGGNHGRALAARGRCSAYQQRSSSPAGFTRRRRCHPGRGRRGRGHRTSAMTRAVTPPVYARVGAARGRNMDVVEGYRTRRGGR